VLTRRSRTDDDSKNACRSTTGKSCTTSDRARTTSDQQCMRTRAALARCIAQCSGWSYSLQ
jgi:hypothetical protein